VDIPARIPTSGALKTASDASNVESMEYVREHCLTTSAAVEAIEIYL
jgi:hypothetical protein